MKKTLLKNFMKKNKLLYFLLKGYCKVRFQIRNLKYGILIFGRSKGFFANKYTKMKAYKNKHLGERCFITCTGPSLTINDLELLKNEYTFGMNSICLAFEQTDWRPIYFGIQDLKVYNKVKENIKNSGLRDVFVSGYLAKKFKVPMEWVRFPLYTHYNTYDANWNNKYYAKFSKDADVVIYSGIAITYSLIQIAVYMGFKEIYLLGCDCKYSKEDKNHFIEHGAINKNSYDEDIKKMLVAYETAKKFCDEYGIKIYNATRGGYLEVFERINLEDIQGIGIN